MNASPQTLQNPASAVMTPASGAERFAPIPRARIAALFATSNTPRLKFLDKLCAEQKAHDAARTHHVTDSAELSRLMAALQSKGETEEWSQRELARKAGFTWRTWGRVCAGHVPHAVYLPKLKAAATRLQSTERTTNQ